MSSPQWCRVSEVPVAAAIAAAVHIAWKEPSEQLRVEKFRETLRKMVGPVKYEKIVTMALHVFNLQEQAPEGYEELPEWVWFEACPKCMSLRRTKYTAPQNGRLKLQLLRDKDWLARQIEAGRTTGMIAKRLDCTASLVVDWIHKHGLKTQRAERTAEIEATVRHMHANDEGPGTIAKACDTDVRGVQQALKRLGLATKKSGQVYHRAEWWRHRIVIEGKTKLQCAREAGIQPHAATYWVKRHGLQHLVRDNKRGHKYPVLTDRMAFQRLYNAHDGNYESIAREIGCAPTNVAWWAKRTLGVAQKHFNHVPHSAKSWWVERLNKGMTTYELAEEAGIEEKTAREKLRLFDLLTQAYGNNTARERNRGRRTA